MKYLFLTLLFLQACASQPTQVFKGDELVEQLERNHEQLDLITAQVQGDYNDKEMFTKVYVEQKLVKNDFVKQDLYWRLSDLKNRRDEIIKKADELRLKNDHLTRLVGEKKEIKSTDKTFKDIEHFSDTATKEAKTLFEEFEGYKTATKAFVDFAMLTRKG